jgi:hypothetical protein
MNLYAVYLMDRVNEEYQLSAFFADEERAEEWGHEKKAFSTSINYDVQEIFMPKEAFAAMFKNSMGDL